MARRSVYVYRVLISKNGVPKKEEYCYARNAKAAVEGYQKLFASEKYDNWKATPFADAELKRHPEIFSPLPADEVAYIKQRDLGAHGPYSNRKDNRGPTLPKNAEFVPVKKKSEEEI